MKIGLKEFLFLKNLIFWFLLVKIKQLEFGIYIRKNKFLFSKMLMIILYLVLIFIRTLELWLLVLLIKEVKFGKFLILHLKILLMYLLINFNFSIYFNFLFYKIKKLFTHFSKGFSALFFCFLFKAFKMLFVF